MKPIFLILFSLSCHQDIARNDQLYDKWILTDGPASVKRQTNVTSQPVYFTFTSSGSIDSNWSNCYSFWFGKANELLISNGCIDCIAAGCDESVWHYSFSAAHKLTIEFEPGDVGLLRRP